MMDDADALVPCPYNPSHILYRSRLQTHLVKCKWAHENPQMNVEPKIMKVCRFNSNHHILSSEIDAHHAKCTDMSSVARFTAGQTAGSVVPYNPIELPPADENWDNEEYNSTYDPEQHAASAVIIRQKQGVPKSVRKSFRMQERERINRLRDDQQAMEKSAKTKPQPKPAPVENTAFSENRLRPPKSALLGMGRGRIVQSESDQQNQPGLGQGGHFVMQDVPSMVSKAKENDVNEMHSTSGLNASNGMLSPINGMRSPTNGMHSPPNGMQTHYKQRTSASNAPPNYGSMDSQSTSLLSLEQYTSGSGSEEAPDYCAVKLSDMTVDSDGFVEVGKKNKKVQPAKSRGSVPTGSQPASDFLINGSLRHALPGQPGKGRGRLPKN